MKQQSRTQNSIKNIEYSVLSYCMILLLQFVNRSIFIKMLTDTYLGLNGLFSNILSFLSLAELGVGSAINYALYKPIAEGNTELIKSVMQLYQKLYRIIGGVVLLLGCALTPFLSFFIKNMPNNIPYIRVYYLLYVVNSGVSYFYAYKRSFIICNQREYITTVIATWAKFILSFLQIVLLLISRNYALYLIAAIVITIAENIVVSCVVDYLYPYLREGETEPLASEVSKDIRKNVLAMMCHKIGTVVVFSTDNLIVSKYVGLTEVGLYSNYTLISRSVDAVISKIFSAATASVGNLALSEDKDHVKQVLYRMLFFNFWIRGFCAIALCCLLQPFIQLWIGKAYQLSFATVIVIAINFYLGGMRSTVIVFKEASGIFWNDRYKPLIESVLNIILSIPLAIHYGIMGVLLGTIGSTLLVPFWFEAYVLFQHYFQEGIGQYLRTQFVYALITAVVGGGCFILCRFVTYDGIVGFLIPMLICMIVPNVIFTLLFCHTDGFIYFKGLVMTALKRRMTKRI